MSTAFNTYPYYDVNILGTFHFPKELNIQQVGIHWDCHQRDLLRWGVCRCYEGLVGQPVAANTTVYFDFTLRKKKNNQSIFNLFICLFGCYFVSWGCWGCLYVCLYVCLSVGVLLSFVGVLGCLYVCLYVCLSVGVLLCLLGC